MVIAHEYLGYKIYIYIKPIMVYQLELGLFTSNKSKRTVVQ